MSIQDWRKSTINGAVFRKEKLVDSIDVDQSLLIALSKMQE